MCVNGRLCRHSPMLQSAATSAAAPAAPASRKCVLISSSGSLLAARHGSDIDRADLVARFNDAPAGGAWSRHVGQHTSVRFISSSTLPRVSLHNVVSSSMVLERSEAVYIDWLPRHHGRMAECHGDIVRFHRNASTNVPFRCVPGPTAQKACRWPLRYRATSGLLVLSLLFRTYDCASGLTPRCGPSVPAGEGS